MDMVSEREKARVKTRNFFIFLVFLLVCLISLYFAVLKQQGIPGKTRLPMQVTGVPAPANLPQGKSCRVNSDCGKGEFCAVAGPIIYNPKTKSVVNRATCHKNGTMLPM